MDLGEIQETTDDIYGSISDATSPNEAMYNALSDGEIQVVSLVQQIESFILANVRVAQISLVAALY